MVWFSRVGDSRRSLLLAAAAATLMVIVNSAHADGMMIPHSRDVKLFEPNQRAMIAWNGQEELLLLTTEVRASAPTKVLQVVPFPSEPKVTAGDIKPFERAVQLINAYLVPPWATGRRPPPSAGASREPDEAPIGRITKREQIGAHQLTVVEALSADHFVTWVDGELAKDGVARSDFSPGLRSVIEAYLKDGIRWFVFDSLELQPQLRRVQPLRYRFATDKLFYPLRITRVEGPSDVNLTVFTRQLFKSFPQLAGDRVRRQHFPLALRKRQVLRVDEEIAALFEGDDPVYLRLWRIADTQHGFDRDLIAF